MKRVILLFFTLIPAGNGALAITDGDKIIALCQPDGHGSYLCSK